MKKPVYTLDERLLAALMLLFHVLLHVARACADISDDYTACFVAFMQHSNGFLPDSCIILLSNKLKRDIG